MPAYTIEIKFDVNEPNLEHYIGVMPYRSSSNKTDFIEISNNYIKIRAERAKSINSDVLQQHNGTISKQIIKGLCLYYLFEKKSNRIVSIKIYNSKNGNKVVEIGNDKLSQVLKEDISFFTLSELDANNAVLLFEESEVGRAILYAATHLIKSTESISPSEQFEKLWKSFNALYKALAKKTNDHDCLKFLKNHMQTNGHLYKVSVEKINFLNHQEILDNTKWNQMILNNHPEQQDTKSFCYSILRNTDSRILKVYQEKLPIREEYLKNTGFYEQVMSHINQHLSTNTVCDEDVLATLCCRYMYFVRNKIIHAEKTDSCFSFIHDNEEDTKIRWLIPILEAVVIDMINFSETF